jgi:hypothetical protein
MLDSISRGIPTIHVDIEFIQLQGKLIGLRAGWLMNLTDYTSRTVVSEANVA